MRDVHLFGTEEVHLLVHLGDIFVRNQNQLMLAYYFSCSWNSLHFLFFMQKLTEVRFDLILSWYWMLAANKQPVRLIVSVAYKPADAVLLWEKNTVS